jgi:hypothetical protein
MQHEAEGKKKDPNVAIPVDDWAGKGREGGGGSVAPLAPADSEDSADTGMQHGKENSEDDLPEMLTSRSGTRSEDSNESPPRLSPLDASSTPGRSLLSAKTKGSGGLLMSEWSEWSEESVQVIDCTASKESLVDCTPS